MIKIISCVTGPHSVQVLRRCSVTVILLHS